MEEAELNVHPIGLISSDIRVNISFCNNVKNFKQAVTLDILNSNIFFLQIIITRKCQIQYMLNMCSQFYRKM